MALPYSSTRSALLAAASACPKVALYSKVKPVSASASRYSRQTLPPLPLCPSSTRIRLFPSNASTGTLTPLPVLSSTNLVISMTCMVSDMRRLPSTLNRSHRISDFSNSRMCCSLNPSLGVISTMWSNFSLQ